MMKPTKQYDPPEVAVVITTCNRPQFLHDAIESAVGQRFDGRIEIVVVDDGSTDHTARVVQPYTQRYDDPNASVWVRYVYQKNQGLATARNTGIQHTTAPFIAFLDDDDLFEPQKLQLQVNKMRADANVGLVHTSFRYVDKNGNFSDEGPQRVNNPCVGHCLDVLLHELLVISSTVLVRRQTLGQAAEAEPHGLPYDPKWQRSQDYDMTLRIARLSKFAYINTPQLRYRLHDSNIAISPGSMKLAYGYHCRVQIDFVRRYGHEIGIDESEAKRRAAAFLLGRVESNFWKRQFQIARDLCDLARELQLYDAHFTEFERRARRPMWIYHLKDQFDRITGRA